MILPAGSGRAHELRPTSAVTAGEIIVDSFAGGGGASLGITWATGRAPDIAINHDLEAIALHRANHPESEHHSEDVWHVDPTKACRGRPVGLMWLSPDCKHFSKAKGGKPVSPRVRGLAWVAVRWAAAVKPRIIVLENVEEFQTWGPLYRTHSNGCTGRGEHCLKACHFARPIKSRAGETFRKFTAKLRRLGYAVEWRELRASHYNTPTIRKRLFLIARCDGQPIIWPRPTNGALAGTAERSAAECIDWGIPCPSIFTRKKRLAVNTEKRIARGIDRFVVNNPNPFIVNMANGGSERPVSEPMTTIMTEKGGCRALVTPHITKFRTGSSGSELTEPMPTVTANGFVKRPGGAVPLGLVSPVIIPTAHAGDARAHSVEDPLRTITGSRRGDHAMVAPTLVEYHSARRDGDDRARQLDMPLPTQDTAKRFGLVAPHLVRVAHGEQDASGKKRGKGEHSVEDPLPTVLATQEFSVIAPVLTQRYGEWPGHPPRGTTLDKPMPTVVPTQNGADLVEAFLAKHNAGNEATGQHLTEPVHTVTGRDQKALVTSNLMSLRGTEPSHLHGDPVDAPMRTLFSGGNHIAEVRAFLMSYYSSGQAKGNLFDPLGSVTPKERFGLVTVHGIEYVIADIGMRMLAPRELYRAQGFHDGYKIDIPYTREIKSKKTGKVRRVTKPMTKTAQVRMVGNSVCPPLAEAIVRANYVATVQEAIA